MDLWSGHGRLLHEHLSISRNWFFSPSLSAALAAWRQSSSFSAIFLRPQLHVYGAKVHNLHALIHSLCQHLSNRWSNVKIHIMTFWCSGLLQPGNRQTSLTPLRVIAFGRMKTPFAFSCALLSGRCTLTVATLRSTTKDTGRLHSLSLCQCCSQQGWIGSSLNDS